MSRSLPFVTLLLFCNGFFSPVMAATPLPEIEAKADVAERDGLVDKMLRSVGEESATWSLGIGLAVGAYPHYPGAKQSETVIAPFPYPEYHSNRLQLDRDGLAAKLFQSERFKLDMSVNGAFPVSANKNDLRAGMADLELMIEAGPELQISLASWEHTSLRFDIPARAAFEVTTSHLPNHIGWSVDPRLHLEQNFDNWEWEIDVGALWATKAYQDVFYTVDTADVTANRPLYAAKSGLMAWRLSATVERRIGDWRLLGYLRQMDMSSAVNHDSALLAQDHYLAGGVAAIWMFKSS